MARLTEEALLRALGELSGRMDSAQRELASRLDRDMAKLNGDMAKLNGDMAKLSQDVSALSNRVDNVQRTVKAIESFPAPYGRPKTFVRATEFHSVSDPIRTIQGHVG
jgi:predicted nuclease with TOPRIM domain